MFGRTLGLMKVAIACHPTHGGSGVVAAELGMELARRGHEVHFVSYKAPFRIDPLQENVYFHQVEITSYPLFKYPPYALALAAKLVEVVRAYGVKLIHAHYAIPHATSAILTRQMCCDCGLRVITTLHGTDITLVGSDPSFHEITRFALRESDRVTAVSSYLVDATRESFENGREISVIPNFIDGSEFTPEKRCDELRSRFVKGNEALVIHISNFREVKRIPDVVSVFARLSERVPARLLMVGTGPERSPAEIDIENRGIGERVTFLGPVDDVAGLLACADLKLLPSLNESFGLAALEAMASGVPVVATRTGGLPELVEDGVSGLLCDVGDTDCMADRAAELLEDAGRFREMQRAARARAMDLYPTEKVVNQYEALYEETLSSGS